MRLSKVDCARIWWELRKYRKGSLGILPTDDYRASLYLAQLSGSGYVRFAAQDWTLLKDFGPCPPLKINGQLADANLGGDIKDLHQRLWVTMRVLGSFSLGDLRGLVEVGENESDRYLRRLTRAGYLACEARCKRAGSGYHYRLLRGGPAAPLCWGQDKMWDPNEGKEINCAQAVLDQGPGCGADAAPVRGQNSARNCQHSGQDLQIGH